ncbi:MAG TPA: hypothetical protein VFD35_09550 [Pricia sp.]|nr:hypothetical protein [Pricia sp.]
MPQLFQSLNEEVIVSNILDFDKSECFTISGHLDFRLTTGSENLYVDLIVYKNKGDIEKQFHLRLFTKNDHDSLKELVMEIMKDRPAKGRGKIRS